MGNTITIPRPKKLAGTKHGIYSTGHINAFDNKVRISPYDTDLIDRAAMLCGITMPSGKVSRSGFIRFCAVHVANAIIEESENNNTTIEDEEDYNF